MPAPLPAAFLFIAGFAACAVAGPAAWASRPYDTPLTHRDASITTALSSTTWWPHQIAVGDVNADGHPDVTSPVRDSMLVHLGLPDGTLAAPIGVHAPGGADFTAIADFDRDGHADVACAGAFGAAVLFGDGTGGGWTRHALPTQDAWGLAAGDFDGDGAPDVAILSWTAPAGVATHLARGTRTFASTTQALDSLSSNVTVRVADLDRDGRSDLVASQLDGRANVLLSRGDGTFAPRLLADALGASDLADVTGDGVIDLVAGAAFHLRVWPGIGDGTFGAAIPIAPLPSARVYDVRLGDLDQDGVLDLVTTHNVFRVETRRGLGGGSFAEPRATRVGQRLVPCVLADLDRDERLDLVGMSTTTHGMFVARGDGNGGFEGRPRGIAVPSIRSVMAGDFDSDGRADLVFSRAPSPTLGVLLTRPGSPPESRSQHLPDLASLLGVADFNGDAALDLLAQLNAGRVAVLPGRDDGTFADPVATPFSGWTLAIRDANADGRLDLVTSAADLVTTLLGRGDGSFDPPISWRAPSVILALEAGELNGDGVLDLSLVISSGSGFHGIVRALGNGTGNWMPQPHTLDDVRPWVALGDVNADGAEDEVIHQDGWLTTRLQGPAGTWTTGPVSRWMRGGSIVDLDDVNADGRLDVVSTADGGWRAALGDGSGRFADPEGSFVAGAVQGSADLDGDGRRDLYGIEMSGDSLVIAYGRDERAPAVSLLEPAAGAVLPIGGTARVAWEIGDTDARIAEVYVSRHGTSGPFVRVGMTSPEASVLEWPVEGPPSDSLCFKVVVRDAAGNAGIATTPLHRAAAVLRAAGALPPRARIAAVAPNPAGSTLRVTLELPRASRVTLALHDLQGRRAARLCDGRVEAGRFLHAFRVPPTLGPGLYFLRLEWDGGHDVARVTRLD